MLRYSRACESAASQSKLEDLIVALLMRRAGDSGRRAVSREGGGTGRGRPGRLQLVRLAFERHAGYGSHRAVTELRLARALHRASKLRALPMSG